MEIFETITAHRDAMKLPLYAVTVTAVPRADTPLLVIMHWHGFRRETALSLPGVELPPRAVPSSAIQINELWQSVASIDQATLDAAWQLGAWDVERLSCPPWWRLGAPAREVLECHRAFGQYPDDESGCAVIADAPDRDALMEIAARQGYIRWMFRPCKGGLWEGFDDDGTLAEDHGRPLPCPVAPAPYDAHRAGRTVYRLGRGRGLIRPKTF